MDVDEIKRTGGEIINKLSKVVIGYDREIRYIVTTLLANGHALLEGVPGIAKTTLARGLTRLVGLSEDKEVVLNNTPYKGFSRIQFTPDLMPGDIIGSLVYDPKTTSFKPKLGPVFSYIVLADEINRATPRTQSALLQAMQEREVTIGDKTYKLEDRGAGKFFYVIATQNPVEQEGTYPLPEAQLDRFMMRIIMGYPETLEDEKNILRMHKLRISEPVEDLEPIVKPEWIVEAQNTIAKRVDVPDDVIEYISRLERATRPEIVEPIGEFFTLGVSPRGGILLMKAAKAYAALRGSTSVEYRDVNELLFPVLNHRVIPRLEKIIEYGGGFKARLKVIMDGLDKARKLI